MYFCKQNEMSEAPPSDSQPVGETEPSQHTVEELDHASAHFNPLRALYTPEYRVTGKVPKVIYQNLAAFESALKRFGIWSLNKSNKPAPSVVASVSQAKDKAAKAAIDAETNARRFQPHQMPVKTMRKNRHQRNLYKQMASAEGPLMPLTTCLPTNDSNNMPRRLRVYVRKEHGVRGTIEGQLLAFDKHWNLLLQNVVETWRRRKYKFSEQKMCGQPVDCSAQLQRLGVTLPTVTVKSIDRKHVELRREVAQLLVRGEQIVLVNLLPP